MRCSCLFFSLPRQYAAADAHQLERRDDPGGRQVRTAAQVLPAQVAGLGVEVVVDGQLPGAHLGGRALGRVGRRPLEADQLQLVGLGGQFLAGVLVGDRTAGEALAALDDLLHLLLDAAEVVGVERLLDVEVVVEAVLDRRADAELGLREELLHRLGHHVGGGVAQDVEAVLAGDDDRLDLVAVGDRVGQVAQRAADPGGHHGTVAVEELRRRRSRRHQPLFRRGGIALDDHTEL